VCRCFGSFIEFLCCIVQKLEEAQNQVTALTASNQTLREESTAATLRFERTIEALKIAAANAASARTDADQAELSAECLATQLEALQTVVEQTKQAARVLHDEQQEITEQARSGQAKLLKVEAELARSQKEAKILKEKAEEWESKAKELQEESTTLKRQLADETEKSRKLAVTLEERDALEEARKKRNQQVEKELKEAQALLQEASSAAADSDTLSTLNETVEKLQEANKKLHEQLTEQQETAKQDKERLRQSLLLAEQEAQTLRIQASLNGEKDADGENLDHSTTTPSYASRTDLDSLFSSSNKEKEMATPNTSVDKHAVPPSATCSICFKAAFGLMKSCQCGRRECDKRAHLTCANQIPPGPSVSHPGTPAAKLPIVLCSGALAGIMHKD
jgi:DNA repair exonuclease SbcCD ATPase subunit